MSQSPRSRSVQIDKTGLDEIRLRMGELKKPEGQDKRGKISWTQEYLATQAYVNLSTVKRFLKGKADEATAIRILNTLGIEPRVFLEKHDQNSKNSEHELEQMMRISSVEESFRKAVEQLGSNDDWIILSSIYELEKIAKDAEEEYYWKVMETLTRYVRKRSPWNEETEAKAKTERNIPPLPDDIQKVMTVLATRRYSYGHCLELYPLDLRNTDLRRLELPPKAKLGQVNFSGSNLQKAILKEVDLQKSDFSYALLQGIDLKGANLQQAKLWEAKLQRAILWKVNLENAHLMKANLQQTCLAEANLKRAILWKADLQAANLTKANLQKTSFKNLNPEFLPQFGSWQVVGLTWEQLDSADSYKGATLPDDLPPRQQLLQAETSRSTKQAVGSVQAKGDMAVTSLRDTQLASPDLNDEL